MRGNRKGKAVFREAWQRRSIVMRRAATAMRGSAWLGNGNAQSRTVLQRTAKAKRGGARRGAAMAGLRTATATHSMARRGNGAARHGDARQWPGYALLSNGKVTT